MFIAYLKNSWIFILLLVALSIFFFSNSSLFYPIFIQHIDSQVYIHTAHEILSGKILYKDIFDHKGPTMHILECLGFWLSTKNFNGIWWVQLCVFLIGVLPLLFLLKQKGGVLITLGSFIVFLSWIYRFNRIGDNIPEMYAIGFVSLYFYYFLHLIEQDSIIKSHLIGIGIVSILLAFLKLNFAIVLFPSFIFLIYKTFSRTKNFKFLLWIFVGVLIIFIPIFLYFSFHHAIKDAFYAIWLFNLNYVSNQTISFFKSIKEIISFQIYFILFLFVSIIFKIIFSKKEIAVWVILLTSLLLGILVLVGLSGRGADSIHYMIPVAPIVFLLFFYSINSIQKSLMYFFLIGVLYFFKPVVLHYFDKKTTDNPYKNIVSYLNSHKSENETLCVLGNLSCLYEMTNMSCNTPYFYTYPILADEHSYIYNQFFTHFKNVKANWIVLQTLYPSLKNENEILKDYTLLNTFGNEKLFKLKK